MLVAQQEVPHRSAITGKDVGHEALEHGLLDLAGRHGRLVEDRPALLATAGENALALQPIHDGLDRGIGDPADVGDRAVDLRRRALLTAPYLLHDVQFELRELHPKSLQVSI